MDCSAHTRRLWVSASTQWMFVAVCGCPSAHIGRPWLSVCVCVCLSAHTGRSWLSISTYISTLYTQDVRGCPSAHTGRLCVSVSTNRMSVAVLVCPSAHTGRLWLSISRHISTLVLGLSTLTLHVDCSVDFGPHGMSVQYTQDVRGCPPAHTGRLLLSDVRGCLWLSVSVRGYSCASVSTHMMSVAVHQYTYQHAGPWTPARWPFPWTVRHTQDVGVCLSAQTGRLWLFVCVRLCPSAHT
ncbi:unnamed protein product [Brassica rapa]|uniref:Uncharacterized protein n=1 Tax=Brassica campestris TaxID=3711 RepID=A0A8D9CV28_BRACM|nr:unnamed protein product [Brassica rapa]